MKIDWRQAACAGVDPELFFDESRVQDARAYCTGCPIRSGCESHAYSAKESHGVWGGTDADERRKLSRPQVRAKCPGCESTAILDDGYGCVCVGCGLTWQSLA